MNSIAIVVVQHVQSASEQFTNLLIDLPPALLLHTSLFRTLINALFILQGQPRGYLQPTNAMLIDDDPGIMSEVETSSTGFRRGGKQRSSLPVVRTPSKTLERPLGEYQLSIGWIIPY